MASNFETGHAKNIANLNLLNTNILALVSIYNPSNPKINITHLQSLYISALKKQTNVNAFTAPYTMAVDDREALFKPLNRDLTKLRKAYKSTNGVTAAQLEDFMTIVRKLKGERKFKPSLTTNPEEQQTMHSVSQLSYDQRTNNMQPLIALLENTKDYNPNEQEYTIETYSLKREKMLATTQAVADAYIPLNNARSDRNETVYNSEDNLIDLANKAKDYIFTILDTDTSQYKAIARIKFRQK